MGLFSSVLGLAGTGMLAAMSLTGSVSRFGSNSWKLLVGGLISVAGGVVVTVALNGGNITVTSSTQGGSTSTYVSLAQPFVLVPGTGWTGATEQPVAVGDYAAAGYTQSENAIARWDVVPYQTFAGTFKVGVVAFHSSGIDHVAFSVNGGAWASVTAMSANDQTANTSGIGQANALGVVEYWATLRASDFGTDGQIEVRAIAYPKIGTPRVLESLYLNSNKNGSLTRTPIYVATDGSDSTGDGSSGNPFATIAFAADSLNSPGSNPPIDGTNIYLKAGSYEITSTVYQHPNTSTGWLTITPAPGVGRSQVIITGWGRLAGDNHYSIYTSLVHFKNLTFNTPNVDDQSCVGAKVGGSVWIEGCNFTGPGHNQIGNWITSGLGHVYVTDSAVSESVFGLNGDYCDLQRNVSASYIGSNPFYNTYAVVNCSTVHGGVEPEFPDIHADAWMVYAGGGGFTFNQLIVYGFTATDGTPTYFGGQGMFGGGGGLAPIVDIAIINATVSTQNVGESGASVFYFTSDVSNMYVKNSIFTGPANWGDGATKRDAVIEGTTFINWQHSGTNYPIGDLTGVTIR